MGGVSHMKTQNDLIKLIPDFKAFCNFLISHPHAISKGGIAEYYCCLLFNLELSLKINEDFDAKDSQGKRIEIKQRDYTNRCPPGMRLDLEKFDYLLYVSLGKDLLPEEILHFDKAYINVDPRNKRASFARAFSGGEYCKKYSRNSRPGSHSGNTTPRSGVSGRTIQHDRATLMHNEGMIS